MSTLQHMPSFVTGIFIFLAILLALIVICVIALWKIFVKAGRPGWNAIIPIYSIYVFCDIAGKKNLFAPYIIAYIASNVLSRISDSGTDAAFRSVTSAIAFMLAIASIVLWAMVCASLSRAFGKTGSFAFGLVVLPFIFYPILGFGTAQYIYKNNGPITPETPQY